MSNAFADAKTVEARSMLALRPFLEDTHGRYVLTNKGNASKVVQELMGDVLFNDRTGRLWSVEMKAEQKDRPNLFLEVWSNRNLEQPENHAGRGSKPGWLLTTGADLLFYHFLASDKLFICSMFALKKWAFVSAGKRMAEPNAYGDQTHTVGRIWDFEEKVQKSYEQLNDTRGRCVPIAVLQRELRPAPKVVSVRQLALSLFDATPDAA